MKVAPVRATIQDTNKVALIFGTHPPQAMEAAGR